MSDAEHIDECVVGIEDNAGDVVLEHMHRIVCFLEWLNKHP